MSIESQGVHGTGRRDYTDRQYRAVVATLKLATEVMTVEEVARATGVAGRTVREIVSAADGVDFVLGGNGNGYLVADDPVEAEAMTLRLAHQVERMAERLARRQRWWGAAHG